MGLSPVRSATKDLADALKDHPLIGFENMQPIKDICLYLDETQGADSALRVSMALANAFNATVNSIHALPIHNNLSVDTNGYFRKLAVEKASRLRTFFEREMNADRLEHSWETKAGNTVDVVLEAFKFADIGVLSQPTEIDGRFLNDAIEKIIFSSDTPIVCVPHALEPIHRFDRVIVVYDETPASVRAIRDAMPFLTDAKLVELLHIRRPGVKTDVSQSAPMLTHLTHHDVNCSVVEICSAAPSTDVIVQRAAERDATLVVTGSTAPANPKRSTYPCGISSLIKNAPMPVFYSH